MSLCFFFDAVCCFCSSMFWRHKFNRLVSKTKSSLPAPSTSQAAAGLTNAFLLNTSLQPASSNDAEKDVDDEEAPPCEGRRDVHSSAAAAVLFPAVRPTRKDGRCSFCCSPCFTVAFWIKRKIQLSFQPTLVFPGCALLWMGQTCVETAHPRLHQPQSDPAGSHWS